MVKMVYNINLPGKAKCACLMLVCLVLFSCNVSISKGEYLQNFTGFITNLKNNYKSLKIQDWDKIQKQFQNFSEVEFSKYENELDEMEKKQIDNLIGEYYAVKIKYKSIEIKEQLNSISNKANSLFQELKKE